MKKISLFILANVLSFGIANAQLVFHETFEVVDSMTSSGTPTWFQETTLYTEGTHSIRDTVGVGATAYLTSDAFSTTGNFFVLLSFDQICKINFADRAYIEVSNNNGNTWVALGVNQYSGSSTFYPAFGYFSSFSYGPGGWDAANDFAVPQTSWWRNELFDISSVASNAAQVKVRFKIIDGNLNGNSGNYGWLIDNVSVQAAPHELIPPSIRWKPPVMQGTIYYLGPFTVADTITDASAITATLYYTINGGSPVAVTMTNPNGNIWQGIIPAVNDGDTICYYVSAADVWNNTSHLPTAGCISFNASSGITFPYVDNFDINTALWTPTSASGSTWQLGAPAFGVTNSAHSSPNAWDISLTSGYVSNTNSTLTSPVFNFIGVFNAVLSFWRNQRTEVGWDGTRLEYTTNGTTWQVLGTFNDPLGTNWYTTNHINSSNTAAWDGLTAGWIKSSYKLTVLNNVAGPVQFRFIFTSDGSQNQDGISIDDFSITPPSAQDAGVLSILRPGLLSGAGTTDTVKIIITNFGSQPVSNFNVNYSVNGGPAVSQFYSGTLMPADSAWIDFATPYVVPTGAFNLCAFTSLAGDGNHYNDTLCNSSQGIPLVSLPYVDNFDSPPVLWYDSSGAGTSWQLGTPAFGATNSAYSAPKAWDINLTTTYGNNARSVLTSPLFDFTGIVNAKLSFWMNRSIMSGDGVFLEYSANAGASWQRLGTVNDPNAVNQIWYNNSNINATGRPGWDVSSGGWTRYTYLLGAPFNNAGPTVQFRFIFTSNATVTTDGVSIDNFSITLASPVDVGITQFILPGTNAAAGSTSAVQVTFRNYGSTTITTTDLAFSINGTFIAVETWNGSLPPSFSTNFTFAAAFTVPSGIYDICSYTSLLSDGDQSNDTLCKTGFGIPRFGLPYADNFDTGAVSWTDVSTGPGTNWQHGTPAFGITTGAHSLPSCWDINLTTAYNNNALSYLVSPLFDFTGVFNASLSFWQKRNSEDQWDGTRLEYSVNAGSSWSILGSYGDPGAVNWYTDPALNSSNLQGWDSISIGGWQQCIYFQLPPWITGPDVQFRFVFTSDNSIVRDGVSIDDFMISLPPAHDVGVWSILQPTLASQATVTDSVKVYLHNFGTDTTSNFPVSYRINSGSPVTEIYPGTIQPGSYDTFSFSTAYTVPANTFNICAWTSATNDGNQYNDTLCKGVLGQRRFTLPFTDNFNTLPIVWYDSSAGAGTNWQRGTPAFGQTTGAHSSPVCWDINLSTAYQDNANSYLNSPLFDFTGILDGRLSFWQNRNTENNWDGMRLEYSTDAGATWTVLGMYGDPNAINWYNKPIINSSLLPAWDSISTSSPGVAGWQQSTYLHLPPSITGSNVMFRFVFTSDNSVTTTGISVDDFQLYDASPLNVLSAEMESDTWQVYPNPSTGIFYFGKNDRAKRKELIAVTDVLGNEVWANAGNQSEFVTIDLSSKPNGIYFIKVLSGAEAINRKIILCR